MKNVRLLALAVSAMLVANVSAREVRRPNNMRRHVQMEQQFVQCDRCGKFIALRRPPRGEFGKMEFRQERFPKGDFRRGDVAKGHFHKSHKRHMRR